MGNSFSWQRQVIGLGLAVVASGSGMALAQTGPDTLTAAPDSVINIRSGPGTHFAVVGEGYTGDPMTILASHFTETSTWHRIQLQNAGDTGWVRGDLILSGGIPVSDRCHGALATARGDINRVPGGFLRNIYIGHNNLAPGERPLSLSFPWGAADKPRSCPPPCLCSG
ncbi:MAG: SH3 domain-containing protein [Leptolyngbya sp. RL_3_1]|nr:SH3 domain-containing protein [Leptolyngbya sp. RL_3_1]